MKYFLFGVTSKRLFKSLFLVVKKSQIKMSPCGLMKKANKRTVRVQRQLLDKAKKYGLPEHLKK